MLRLLIKNIDQVPELSTIAFFYDTRFNNRILKYKIYVINLKDFIKFKICQMSD